MLKIDLVIPSKGRIQKLEATLNSIFLSARHIPINLYLYFSIQSELDYFYTSFKNIDEIHLQLLDNYRVPDFWNAHLQKMIADVLITGNDDIEFFNDTIEKIIEIFSKDFPDLDGVLGLSQSNLPKEQALEGAFSVIGTKFANRFPNRQVFCPDYHRFRSDYELMQYAKSIGKFKFYRDIKIKHYHPAFGGREDETHRDVRKYLNIDKNTFQERQMKGWLWGCDFNLM